MISELHSGHFGLFFSLVLTHVSHLTQNQKIKKKIKMMCPFMHVFEEARDHLNYYNCENQVKHRMSTLGMRIDKEGFPCIVSGSLTKNTDTFHDLNQFIYYKTLIKINKWVFFR